MSLKCKKFLAVSLALFLFFSIAFSPFYALAVEPEDYAQEILQNYKSMGTDNDGNVILSDDDYTSYMNDVFAYIEKNTSDVSGSETLVKSQTRVLNSSAPVKASSSGSDLILDEVKEKSRFLDLPIFNNFVVDAVKWMITECLSNPIYAGEELPDESETESETETETEPAPPTTSTDIINGIASLASNLQVYTINANQLYERIDIAVSAKLASTKADSDVKLTVTRSGLGATTVFDLEYIPENNTYNPNIGWNSGSYSSASFGFPAGTSYAGFQLGVYRLDYDDNGTAKFSGFQPRIYTFSVNQLPQILRSGSTVVSLASILTGANAVFSENSFYSNSPTYIQNHTLNSSTSNYWNSYNVSNISNTYITSGTTIDTTNYNNYANYGYYVDNSGNLAIDLSALEAYINNSLISAILAGYVDFYTRFPEVGVNVNDTDIQYVDPFESDEPDPTETGSGSGSLQIDYNEILSEKELESILNQETYYIPEITTDFVAENYTIMLPETESETDTFEVVQAVATSPVLISYALGWLKSWGIFGMFISLATIHTIWNKILK